jgi:hypothetical protein
MIGRVADPDNAEILRAAETLDLANAVSRQWGRKNDGPATFPARRTDGGPR